MKLKNRMRSICILLGFFLLIAAGCGKKIPGYEMAVTSFRLNIPGYELDRYFREVTDLDLTDKGEFIITDIAMPGVLRFDPQGNFVNNIAGYGSGNYEALCSVTPVDTLLAVNTLGLLEFFRPVGTPVNRHFLRGRGDISVAIDGSFVINRMYDSRLLKHCLETYNNEGKLINAFRTPRCTEEGKEFLDFAFSRITPDQKIVYLPASVDSGFIYDFNGNLLLAKKIVSKIKAYSLAEDKPGPLIEDIYVNTDGIFIVRVNKKLSNENMVYFDLIEQYDFDFNPVANYTFQAPLTMTVKASPYSPWYHKFVCRNGIFYFVISQPFEQLIAFQAK